MSRVSADIYGAFPGPAANGELILLSTTPTLIHTATNDPDTFDEIYVYGIPLTVSQVLATILWGGTAAKDFVSSTQPIAGFGTWCIIPGWRLCGGLPVYGFAASANSVSINISVVNRTNKVTV